MWLAIVGIFGKLMGMLPMLGAWLAGRASQRAKELDAGMKGLNDALDARDNVRGNAVARDRLRDKFRDKQGN